MHRFLKITLYVSLSFLLIGSVKVRSHENDFFTEEYNRALEQLDASHKKLYSSPLNALSHAKNAYFLASKIDNDSLKYLALRAKGYANGYLGNFDLSLQNMSDVFHYFKIIHDTSNMAKALSDMAYLKQALSEPESVVMDYNIESLKLREAIADTPGIAYSLNNIGALYWKWEKFDKAVDYFFKALPYFEKLNLTEEIATTTGNIGAYYIENNQFDSARVFLNKALIMYRDINHNYGEALTLANFGKVLLREYDLDSALFYNEQSRIIRENIGDREGLTTNYYNIGYIAYQQHDFQKAEELLLLSLDFAGQIGLLHKKIEITETLSEFYNDRNNFEKAYNYLKTSKTLNDSIFGVEKHRQLEEIREKYDSERKENENLRLKTENEASYLVLKRNRMIFYIALGFSLLMLIIMYLIFSTRRAKDKLKALINEQRLLRSQMNPHFIFNAISAIQNYILTHPAREAINYLSSISSLMRLVIYNSQNELITIESEEKLLHNYLSLQQLRFPNKFDYGISISDGIDKENIFMPPMLVQPFVENSIEHAFKNIDYKGSIMISFSVMNEMLNVVIDDNGIGISESKKINDQSHRPFAIDATCERLKILNKRSKAKVCFNIYDKSDRCEGKGTVVRFSFPLTIKKH